MKYSAFIILGAIAFFSYTLHPTSPPPAFAQSCTSTTARATGLVSAPQVTAGSKFGTSSGACIIDPKAAFTPYKVPSYNDLKSLYYTQSKSGVRKQEIAGNPSQGTFTSAFTSNDILFVNGDLPNLNYTGTTKPSVIFV